MDIFWLIQAFLRVEENLWTRCCLFQLTFVSVKHSRSTPLSWRFRHSWRSECSPFPRLRPLMLRLRILRFSFGLVVNLSPKYSFVWDFWRLSRVGWIVLLVIIGISFWWVGLFLAHLKPKPVILLCLGVLGKSFVVCFFWLPTLLSPFVWFEDWFMFWGDSWRGCAISIGL